MELDLSIMQIFALLFINALNAFIAINTWTHLGSKYLFKNGPDDGQERTSKFIWRCRLIYIASVIIQTIIITTANVGISVSNYMN